MKKDPSEKVGFLLQGDLYMSKKQKKDGKFLERVVQLIEKSLAPDSTVERDVWLPVLASSKNETRQCDVVIRKTNPHGSTIWIVEVQDRKGQVKVNDFGGWLGKMKDVGAQHLICVSRREFPESIKELSKLSGNTSSLITLNEAMAEEIPVDFIQCSFNHSDFEVTFCHTQKLSFDENIKEENRPKGAVMANEKRFSFDKNIFFSIDSLAHNTCTPLFHLKTGRCTLKYNVETEPFLFYKHNEEFIKVNLEFDFDWKGKITNCTYFNIII
jgi:hypothetical protein